MPGLLLADNLSRDHVLFFLASNFTPGSLLFASSLLLS